MAFESNPFQRRVIPDVVKNLLIINGLFFLATFLLEKQNFDLSDILGLHYFQAPKFKPFQLVSYMFMHGGFWHIFLNMLTLWMFGSSMENEWGPKRFLVYYFVCGIGAGIIQNIVIYYTMQPAMSLINDYISHPGLVQLQNLANSDVLHGYADKALADHYNAFYDKFYTLYQTDQAAAIQQSVEYMTTLRNDIFNAPVVVGASGAIFGLLLAYGMTFPNNLIFIYGIIPLKAKYFVLVFGLWEFFSGVVPSHNDNVAHFAHLGGILFGFLLIMYWRNKDRHRFNRY